MTAERPEQPDRAVHAADLADLILTIARKLNVHEFDDPQVVTLSQLESVVMRSIDRHAGIAPSQIGADLGLASGNMSAALRSLEAKGLVRRAPDEKDGRAVRVYPTVKAAENLERIRASWNRVLMPVIPDGADVRAAVALLARIDAGFHAGQKSAD